MGLSDEAEALEPVATTLGDPPGPIASADPYGEAGRKAMWPHVQRLLRFEASLGDSSKVDDLKRYRVATRRLRSALRLFGDAYPDRKVAALRAALGDLGRAAGSVRDLDVRIAAVEPWAADAGDAGDATGSIQPLLDAWRTDRASAAAVLRKRVGSRRHERLLRNVIGLANGHLRLTVAGRRTVRDTAASRIWKAFENLREQGARARWADLAAMHEVRIDAKRLRYSLELLGDVLPPERAWLIERLVKLQDHLGAINDAAAIAAAARTLLGQPVVLSAADRAAIERFARDRDRDVARLAGEVGRSWRPIASVGFARRLGRAVVIA